MQAFLKASFSLKAIILFLIMFILFNSSGFSQIFPVLGSVRINDLVFLPQGYMLPNLSGYGYSKTISDVSNIGNLNPASLTSFNTISGGFSYQYDSKIDEAWIVGIGYAKNKNGIPQSAGFVYPYRNFRFGVGFNQKFNESLVVEDEPIRTPEHPEGTGEFFSIINDYNLLSYSISAAWSVQNTIAKEDKFSLGFRYELNMLNVYQQFWKMIAKGQFYSSNYALGVTYEGLSKDDFNYKISLFFEKGVNIEGDVTLSEPDLLIRYNLDSSRTGSNGLQGTAQNTFPTRGTTPDKINAGLDFNVSVPLRISTNFTWILWHNIGNSANQPEVSLSALYKVSDLYSVSFGTYFIRYNIPGFYFGTSDELNAVYLTAGTVIHYGLLDFNIGLADSHLMSGNWRKQTVGMVSLSFHL
jgi:hypothetical protein